MEATLLVTPEQLESTAGDFSAKATQVKALHDSMIDKVNKLGSSWTGEASEAYSSKFNALKASMETIHSMIQEHVKDLNTIAQQYKTAETQAKAAADELPPSTLS